MSTWLHFFLFFISIPQAFEVSPFNSNQSFNWETSQSKPSLAMIFQKDCHFCKKQGLELSCLEELYSINLWGSYDTKESLQREFIKLKTSYPGFYISETELNHPSLKKGVTPLILFFDKKGKLQFTVIGFNPCQEIKKSILRLSKNG